MAKSYEELELEQKNETEFVLSKTEQDGTKREFLLSETDVVLLGRVVPSIVRQINAGKSPGFGILARPAAPMTEALLNIDLEERLVLLRIRDAWEGELDYSLEPSAAHDLADRLHDWADRTKPSRPTQQ
jgi:hypothetical protein